MKPSFTYKAFVEKVIDGDTVDFMVDLGFNVRVKIRTRLNGIDTPEVSTPEGRDVRDRLRNMILLRGDEVTLNTFKDPSDKYGRWLADVWLAAKPGTESVHLNQWLIDQGYAKAYFGGKKEA